MTFVPKAKNSIKEKIKDYLMNGYILRYDFQENEPIEVMNRDLVKYVPTMHNIGQEKSSVIENIYCSHSVLHEVTKELENNYSVRYVRCNGSGCCQYTTYGVYLD